MKTTVIALISAYATATHIFEPTTYEIEERVTFEATPNEDPTCWKLAYGRGVGKPIHACPSDEDKDGLLCYPLCREGYTGVGPVCWQNCPPDFRNDGAYCGKPSSYGRGAGSTKKCDNCEKYGLLWYPICRDSYHNVGCCVCSPDCQYGMHDIGVSCQKDSYGRTAGDPLGCSSDEDYDAGLCYPICENGADGVGPVCWGHCPPGTTDCGGTLCLENSQTCSQQITDEIGDSLNVIIAVAEGSTTGSIIDISKLMLDFTYPECADWY